MFFREATIADIPQMHQVRTAVQENVLSDPGKITQKDYETFLFEKGKGWVCENETNLIVGFAIISVQDHNVWALFILPEWEGKGIGTKLQYLMLQWYFTQTQQTVWLSTDAQSRAATFYKKTGWKEAGWYNSQELKFEMSYAIWKAQNT